MLIGGSLSSSTMSPDTMQLKIPNQTPITIGGVSRSFDLLYNLASMPAGRENDIWYLWIEIFMM